LLDAVILGYLLREENQSQRKNYEPALLHLHSENAFAVSQLRCDYGSKTMQTMTAKKSVLLVLRHPFPLPPV